MRGRRPGEKRPTLVPKAKRYSCANSREVSRRSKTSSIYRRHATTDTQQMASIYSLRRKGKCSRQDICNQKYGRRCHCRKVTTGTKANWRTPNFYCYVSLSKFISDIVHITLRKLRK